MKSIENPVSAFQFGILTTIEMAVAMLIYIPVAWLADKGNKKIFVVITFCFFTAFPIILYHSRSFWPLAIWRTAIPRRWRSLRARWPPT